MLQEIVPSFQKQFRCRYPSLERRQGRFSTPPEICTTGRTPRCNWSQLSIHPAKPISISCSSETRQAAGRPPVEVAREGARRCGRPLIFDLGRVPGGVPTPGPVSVSSPVTPRPRSRDSNIFPGPPPATFAVSLVIAEGDRRIRGLADMPLVRQWQVGCHSKSLQASLRGCGAIHGGVVLSKHAWLSDTYGFQHHPRRRG